MLVNRPENKTEWNKQEYWQIGDDKNNPAIDGWPEFNVIFKNYIPGIACPFFSEKHFFPY